MKDKNKLKTKKTSIGGQAVLEGVMMRGKTSMATAVRDADGIIRVETKRLNKGKKPNRFLKLPLIRGVVSFVSSLFTGTKVLMRSAEVFGEGEPSKFEKWVAEKFKINVFTVISTISMVIALGLAVFLFMWLPQNARMLLERLFDTQFTILAKNFIEGGFKLLIFLVYIVLCSLIKDVRRTFMYHGAEHKTITCYEKNLPLTVENAKNCRRVHDRCGTTFLVLVMLISIIVFACFESIIGLTLTKGIRIFFKIALLPIIAGISYEVLKLLSKTDCFIFFPLKAPGLLLQLITTKEPEDQMLEVAITAFNKVLEMDENPDITEVEFIVPKKRKEVLADVVDKLNRNGIDERAEAEWIMSLTLKIARSQVNSDELVSPKQIDQINQIVNERISGRPLWYCVGDCDFYGYTIKVDERVLIPRPETETLVKSVLDYIMNNKLRDDISVLDLCTGSGAIAIALKGQNSNLNVVATDISQQALDLAKENAKLNNVEIEFLFGDLFDAVKDRKFDLIVSNPPYIKNEDLDGLQNEVKNFEPILALDGGEDGLKFYKRIAKDYKRYLLDGGALVMEYGINQTEQIKRLFNDCTKIEIIKDLENIDRIILAVV